MKIHKVVMGARTIALLLGAAGVLSLSGCAVDAVEDADAGTSATEQTVFTPPTMSAEAEISLRLIAQVEVPNQAVVKFFEPQAGVIFITEAGRNGRDSVITPELNALPAAEIYESISGQKAPVALAEATVRAAELKELKSSPDAARAASKPALDVAPSLSARGETLPELGNVARTRQALNGYEQWFFDNFCSGGSEVGSGTWDWVIQWMWVSGSGSFTRSDQNWATSTVSVYSGDSIHYKVEIQPWYSWSNVADVTVANGYYYNYHRHNGTDFDFRVNVNQASGASYHWCAFGDSW